MLRDPSFLLFICIAFVVATELQFYYVLTAPFLESVGAGEGVGEAGFPPFALEGDGVITPSLGADGVGVCDGDGCAVLGIRGVKVLETSRVLETPLT